MPPPRWPRLRRVGLALGLGAVLALVVAALALHATGGRWLVVMTPSMGTAAPVGTLLLTTPTTVAQLHVGDVVSYHPSGEPGATITHRVVALTGSGATATATTRGDINGASDPWAVHDANLVGRVDHRLWTLGWLARALPLLAGGYLVLRLLTTWLLRPEWRSPVRMLGVTLLLAVASVRLRPFLGAVQLVSVTEPGATRISLVSTGILPLRISAPQVDAVPLDLRSGGTGVLTVTGSAPAGEVHIDLGLHLSTLGWVLLVLVWLVPVGWSLLQGRVVERPRHDRSDHELRVADLEPVPPTHHHRHDGSDDRDDDGLWLFTHAFRPLGGHG